MKRQQHSNAMAEILQLQQLRQDEAQMHAAEILQRLQAAEAQYDAALLRADQAISQWRASLEKNTGLDPARSAAYAAWAMVRRRDLDALARDTEHVRGAYADAMSHVERCQATTQSTREVAKDARKAALNAIDEQRLAHLEDVYARRKAPQ